MSDMNACLRSICRRAVTRSLAAILLALSAGVSLLAASAHAATVPVPSVTTGSVSNVTYSSAILYGEVNAHGQLTSYMPSSTVPPAPTARSPRLPRRATGR